MDSRVSLARFSSSAMLAVGRQRQLLMTMAVGLSYSQANSARGSPKFV